MLHAASPGPALPGRARPAAGADLRHRARRPAAGLRAGRPRLDRRGGARADAWRRATRPPTGRPGRCPSPGCATQRSTSRSWSSCATCWPPSSTSRASGTGPRRSSRPSWPRRPPPPRVDPWRRTSGMHRVRKRRQLAVVRALWERRDEVARRRDIAPGRVLPDPAIVGRRARRPAHRGRAGRAAGLGRPVACAARPRPGCPRSPRPHWRCPRATCPTSRRPHEGPPPARSLARARPRCRCPAVRRPRRRRSRWPPSATACRSRTCSPPTPCAGCVGAAGAGSDAAAIADAPARPRCPPLAGRSSPRRRSTLAVAEPRADRRPADAAAAGRRRDGEPGPDGSADAPVIGTPGAAPCLPHRPPAPTASGRPAFGNAVLRESAAVCLGKGCLTCRRKGPGARELPDRPA